MGKTGRKNKYQTHVEPYFDVIEDMCRNGATDEQIYRTLGVGRDSFYRYKKQYTELSDILKRNKIYADAQVENALFKNAIGQVIKEKKPVKLKEIIYNDAGKKIKEIERVEVVEVETQIKGDTTAQIFWQKNRRKEEWRDRHNIEHEGKLNVDFSHENLSDEELIELAKKEGIDISKYTLDENNNGS